MDLNMDEKKFNDELSGLRSKIETYFTELVVYLKDSIDKIRYELQIIKHITYN